MINTKHDRKNLYMKLAKLDVLSKLKKMITDGKYKMRPGDCKFEARNPGVGINSPWVYVQPTATSRCDLYHGVFWQYMEHIHTHCRSCWKVVIRPQTLEQLFDLYEIH